MATKIVTKNSSTASAVPTASDLVQGELAVNVADKRLFTEDNGGTIVELGVNPSAEIVANGGIALPDNGKATFGAGDDLQIFHDGGNSRIYDQGTGALVVRSNQLNIQSPTGEKLALFNQDSDVELYYDDSLKLATTSTGIDVTGTATMDGLTVDAVNSNFQSTGATAISIIDTDSTNDVFKLNIENGGRDGRISVWQDIILSNTGGTLARFDNGGDVSFYEDTGTTPKLFWDASAESLGIGTDSPSQKLDIIDAGTTRAFIKNTNLTSSGMYIGEDSNGQQILGLGAYPMRFGTNATERMRITSSGDVGIGTADPDQRLHIADVTNCVFIIEGGNTGGSYVNFADTDDQNVGQIAYDHTSNFMGFRVNDNEKMRIDASGNLLVGTTGSPSGTVEGIKAASDGVFSAAAAGTAPLVLYRHDSDGNIVNFHKDGTNVGSIGTDGTNMWLGDTNTGLRFRDSGDHIQPYNPSSNATRDAAIDLGGSSTRFKDLYLSGKVASAANNFYQLNDGSFGTVIQSAGGIKFNTAGGNERARIDSSGNLLVGTTTSGGKVTINSPSNDGLNVAVGNNRLVMISKRDNDGDHIRFLNSSGANVGNINVTGTTTTYTTSSDQRLKENIADADDAGSKIDAIQVRKYDWKADGSHQDYGMIAQELVEVAPEAVSVPEDSEEMMGVDYSKLVPMLIKEIQSLRNRVAQLETGE
jgi:hypothetical protein